MCWIVFALPICIFMALFTLRVLCFEPVKFLNYTVEEFVEYKNTGLYIIAKGTCECLKVFYIVIGTAIGLVLAAILRNSYIEVLTGIGLGIVIVGTAFAVFGAFILLDKLLKKICNL